MDEQGLLWIGHQCLGLNVYIPTLEKSSLTVPTKFERSVLVRLFLDAMAKVWFFR